MINFDVVVATSNALQGRYLPLLLKVITNNYRVLGLSLMNCIYRCSLTADLRLHIATDADL